MIEVWLLVVTSICRNIGSGSVFVTAILIVITVMIDSAAWSGCGFGDATGSPLLRTHYRCRKSTFMCLSLIVLSNASIYCRCDGQCLTRGHCSFRVAWGRRSCAEAAHQVQVAGHNIPILTAIIAVRNRQTDRQTDRQTV